MTRQSLFVCVLGMGLLMGAVGQTPELGFCGVYETSGNFSAELIAQIENSEARFSFILSSGSSGGCKKLQLYSTGIYFYQTTDTLGNPLNVSSTVTMKPHSSSSPATIALSGLPFTELGALLGSVTFNVLVAEKEKLVLLSCYNVGLIRFRQLHVLVAEEVSSSLSPHAVQTELISMKVPLASSLKQLPRSCFSSFSKSK
ncbi:uncharacterized protein LOC108682966 [Hyalella azteca]|uniref:Uncharacterized protein LOC108682966 n=1 Tax=Hyalella azteca TaxID=294128 RepID=A0A8B7PR45_HYAAZ|nr:uncharacterized protein LOC108682966 [Hyalella azteca]